MFAKTPGCGASGTVGMLAFCYDCHFDGVLVVFRLCSL